MKIRLSILLVAIFGLNACGPLIVQSPGAGLSPVNAVSQGQDEHLMLAGHDVVNYFTDNTHAMGLPEHKSVYKEVSFWFASAEHKADFDASPEKFIPQYGGYCANGIAYAIPWGGDANTWQIIDGKLYIFGGKGSLDAFLLDPKANLALAEQYWSNEVSGSNAFVQRSRRLIFKVPHYKTGAELAEMVAVDQAKKQVAK